MQMLFVEHEAPDWVKRACGIAFFPLVADKIKCSVDFVSEDGITRLWFG